MAQDFAKSFYKSKAWIDCRQSYIASVFGLCERCNKQGKITPGLILHHKVLLTPININNPEITFSHELLEYLCLDCHNITHSANEGEVLRQGLMFDCTGDIIQC